MATVAVSQCTKQSDYATSTASCRFACNAVSTTSRHLSHTSSSTSGLQPRWSSYAMPSSNRPRPHTCERPASYARNNMNISNQAESEYKHVLAIYILRSLFVARTPSEEARSPGRRSNVENAPRRRSITGEPATPTFHIRRAILRTPPSPASQRQAARADPAQPAARTMSSYRKLVTRVRVMLPWQRKLQPVPRLQIRPIVHN